jgi:hypothetical protein
MVIGETFEEASHMLSEHLRKQGKPDQLVWIFQEDITGFRRKLFVHPLTSRGKPGTGPTAVRPWREATTRPKAGSDRLGGTSRVLLRMGPSE